MDAHPFDFFYSDVLCIPPQKFDVVGVVNLVYHIPLMALVLCACMVERMTRGAFGIFYVRQMS